MLVETNTTVKKSVMKLRPTVMEPLSHALLEQAGEQNVVIGVSSISTILAMLRDGAEGETKAELQRVVGNSTHPDLPADVVSANAIWVRQGLLLALEYRDLLTSAYGAELKTLPVQRPGLAINSWVARNTAGRIQEIVDVGFVADLVAVNAFYFHGDWITPFEEAGQHPFHATDGTVRSATFMRRLGELIFVDGPNFVAIALPYAESDLVFELVMPRSTAWSLDQWPDLATPAAAPVDLSLPEFNLSTQVSLKSTLEALGIRTAFQPGQADFSPMTTEQNDLTLGNVLHRADITIDRFGTEAAAATAATMFGSLPVVELMIDRPFYFAISARTSSRALIIGRFTGNANPVLSPRS
jgi:serpin B